MQSSSDTRVLRPFQHQGHLTSLMIASSLPSGLQKLFDRL